MGPVTAKLIAEVAIVRQVFLQYSPHILQKKIALAGRSPMCHGFSDQEDKMVEQPAFQR